jgi:predicted metal-dependent peptidase
MSELPRRVRLTRKQEDIMIEARVSFMRFGPFWCYFYYEMLEEYYTDQIETLATDSKRVFINPDYVEKLTPMERAFALAHEVNHVLFKHPQRMKFYDQQGHIDGVPYDAKLANICMDLPINAHLVDIGCGSCNPNWLYDPKIKADVVWEDLYKTLWKKPPPPPPGGGGQCDKPGGSGGTPSTQPPTTGSGRPTGVGDNGNDPWNLPSPTTSRYGDHKRGGKPDQQAAGNDGRFDEVMHPHTDTVTGAEEVPSEQEFIEAVARAAASAKAIGKLPGSVQRWVDSILEPQVQWRDHIRMVLAGKLGQRKETWATPNRRRIVLNPMIYMPGKKGHGCEDVTVVVDNSGSITEKEMTAFFTEASAILADCRPKLVRVIWCDAQVQRVEEARCLDELADIRVKGSPGGGGTSFVPPFDWLSERGIEPDTLVYLTDMQGRFPADPKTYPVVWCATTGIKGPFGETVQIDVRK